MAIIRDHCFLVQQRTAIEEGKRFLDVALKTGKVLLSVPPDCFLWTGTESELRYFLSSFTTLKSAPGKKKKRKIYRCGKCKHRICKNATWCPHCGANDEDE